MHFINYNTICLFLLLFFVSPSCCLSLLVLSTRLPLVFSGCTNRAKRPQPAGFLAHCSSSSAFCFHQWTTILHLCCVSKYLLAFLFLTASTDFSVYLCARVWTNVCSLHVYTLVKLSFNTCTVRVCSSLSLTRCPVLSLTQFSSAPPHLLFIIHLANSHQRKEENEEEVIAVFSCTFLSPLLAHHNQSSCTAKSSRKRIL